MFPVIFGYGLNSKGHDESILKKGIVCIILYKDSNFVSLNDKNVEKIISDRHTK